MTAIRARASTCGSRFDPVEPLKIETQHVSTSRCRPHGLPYGKRSNDEAVRRTPATAMSTVPPANPTSSTSISSAGQLRRSAGRAARQAVPTVKP